MARDSYIFTFGWETESTENVLTCTGIVPYVNMTLRQFIKECSDVADLMGCNRFDVEHENGDVITEEYLQMEEEQCRHTKRTVYISGKVTGTTDYVDRFFNAENKLDEMRFNVVNPIRRTEHLVAQHEAKKLPPPEWSDYMSECLVALSGCDTIYMLKDWKDSKGARMEHRIAQQLGMKILYEEGSTRSAGDGHTFLGADRHEQHT